jgi:DNA-binding response OmpR family regulator
LGEKEGGAVAETIIKVLLVEDDRDDSRFIQDLLEDAKRARFAVTPVFTGKDGLAAAQKQHYDVVLLDYRLPDADGLDLVKQVHLALAHVPVIMVTSHGDRSLQNRALDAGALEYLEKGSITADLLERTCIYANGLSQASLGRFPEFKILIDMASSNSKELLQIHKEVSDLRSDVNLKLDRIQTQSQEHVSEQESRHTELMTAVRHLAKLRWLLDWATEHRATAVILVLCLLVILIVVTVLLQSLDLEVLKLLLQPKGTSLLTGDAGWLLG